MMRDDTADAIAAAQTVLDGVPFHDRVLRPRVVGVDVALGTLDVVLGADPTFRRRADEPALHGGVVAALIDLAAYNAAALHGDAPAPTLDLRVDYLRPAVPPIVARARVVRAGRRIMTVDVAVEDEAGRVVALGRGSFAVLGA